MARIKLPDMTSSDYSFLVSIFLLLILGLTILTSIAPTLFPLYYFYVLFGLVFFLIFAKIDFEIVSLFSVHLYILSLVFLILPLLIGQVTRGAVRWIPLGPLSIQPAEIIRPFLLIFFANYLTNQRLELKRIIRAFGLLFLPLLLILLQPSLGVAILTAVGFLGVLMASDFDKKYLLIALAGFLLVSPLVWQGLAPYQKQRIVSFINPSADPLGAGYNSIQSMISVGSGKLTGRGLGKGVQTQLAFLPERHTDFIFASISEELGFVGASLVLVLFLVVFLRLIKVVETAKNQAARAFVSGFFLTLFVQVIINVGMNLGLMPITGVPLPLVSAGGSSLLGTLIGLGVSWAAIRRI